MKNLAPLLTLLHLANAIPYQRRIPDILAQIKQQQQQQQLVQEDQDQVEPQLQLQLSQDEEDASSDVKTLYFDQRLDHFSAEDTDGSKDDGAKQVTFFKQRYFYTSRYVHEEVHEEGQNDQNSNVNANVVVFLCVGGEGPSMDTSVLVDSVHCTGDMIGLAKKIFEERGYDVHLYALEHRYYGQSFPQAEEEPGYLRGISNDDSNDKQPDYTYKYLSSRQAVQDIANFVKSTTTSTDHLDSKVQWITFGGSYPGMLSAWSHLLHPEAIHAAVSSSAPIQAQLDFSQYNEHVGNDLQNEDFGGSELCHDIVKEGHAQVVAVFDGKVVEMDGGETTVEDVDAVAALFNVCNGEKQLNESKRNQEAFVGDGLIRIPAQGNDPSCKGDICNIKGLCDTITKERKSKPNKSSMEILATINKLQRGNNAMCSNVEWKDFLNWWKVPTEQNANDRSWLYQTCNEFGFYQTCNQHSTCPYGRGYHDVTQDLETCQEVFGIEPDAVRNNVQSTLTYYGGRKLTPNTGGQVNPNNGGRLENSSNVLLQGAEDTGAGQKRILFVTGDVDPWTELAVTEGNSDHPSISVRGASHHFWTHAIKDTDSNDVVKARESIYDTVIGWMGESTNLATGMSGEAVVVMSTE